jgi:hypothetical protein
LNRAFSGVKCEPHVSFSKKTCGLVVLGWQLK